MHSLTIGGPPAVSMLELSSRLSGLKQVFICVTQVGVSTFGLHRKGLRHRHREA